MWGKEQDCVLLPTYFCSKCLLLRYVLKHRWKFWGKRDLHSIQHIVPHRFRNYKCPEPFLKLKPLHTSFSAIFDWGITWLFWREIPGDPTLFGSGPGFVNRTQSDLVRVLLIRSGPGFVNTQNHVLCHATVFGIHLFPSERIYVTSTQKCSNCIFLKKKKNNDTLASRWHGNISSFLRTSVDRHRSF